MGKSRQRQNRDASTSSRKGGASRRSTSNVTDSSSTTLEASAPKEQETKRRRTLVEWCYAEREGLSWVLGCALVGSLLGFGIGTGHLTGGAGKASPWRDALGVKIRSSGIYRMGTFQTKPWDPLKDLWEDLFSSESVSGSEESWQDNPSHPLVFSILREAVVREPGGYVHPDLGLLTPAPCGAARGLGMVRFSYTECQTNCMPGIASEKRERWNQTKTERKKYKQEEVLLRIPIGIQMTRTVALDTLLPLIPSEVQERVPLEELDDAAILVLLLAHERGLGQTSRFFPYIASLPSEPSCGYFLSLRPYMLDSIAMMGEQMGLDVNGWPAELAKATQYADRIASGLARDYGGYLRTPEGISAFFNIQWALCQVASRATAGSEKHGSLRLVPIMDMVNHDADAGGFVELTGKERLDNGSFLDAQEADSGTFVVRSLRHGRRKPLKKGQELLANYNVPGYSPLDWFVSLGFVPPERWSRWTKIDAALPRVRRDGPFAADSARQTGSQTHMQSGTIDL